MIKLVHTSDWHLGHRLHDVPREPEHRRFLAWLLDRLEEERADGLLIAGDVFEMANPSAAVQRIYYDFLVSCRRRLPELDVVVVGGNHDSAARLDASAGLARALGIHVVGGLPRAEDGSLDVERALVPISGRDGRIGAWVLAVPFLRRMDLPRRTSDADGIRGVYASLVAAALSRRAPDQAIVALGHVYLVGGQLSELSERRIQVGYAEAVSADMFPPEVAYVALGHLHRAQAVGSTEHIRYCGAPLPLALTERAYPHQVRVVVLDGAELKRSVPIRVPRFVDILAVPERHAPLDEVVTALRALPRREPPADHDAAGVPYLEVRVLLDTVQPRLRARVEEALEDAAARLVRIDVRYTGHAQSLGSQVEERSLESLTPREVFERCYGREYDGEVPDDLCRLFDALLEEIQQDQTPRLPGGGG